MKQVLLTLALVLVLATGGLLAVLYPHETVRPLPVAVEVATFEEIDGAFMHRWSDDATFPFLGGAVLDVEGDGRWEVFVGGGAGQPDALLAYDTGRLRDRIADTGLSDLDATYGATAIDIDGDGATDLLIARQGGVDLYTNDGQGIFTRTRLPVDLENEAVPFAVAVSDIDRDGDGDLYVSAFVDIRSFRSAVFNDPSHAKQNVLLRNDGDGFTDITASSGTASLQNTFLSAFVDLDGDRWQDLVVAQNTGEVELFRNLGDTTFEPKPSGSGYGFWMSLAAGDIDRDGDQDLFFSNAGNSVPEFLLRGDLRDDQQLNRDWLLLRNDGDFTFTDVSAAYGLRDVAFAWGATFEDLNLDGHLDLLVAQNYIKLPNFRLRKVPGKAMVQVTTGADAGFYHVDAWGLNNPHFGHAPLIADLDGDARPDVVWLNMDGPVRAFLNRSEANFVTVTLPDDVASLGTRVEVRTAEGTRYTREAVAGLGFMTDQTPELVFGLGASPGPATVVLTRPDGTTTILDSVAINRRIRIDSLGQGRVRYDPAGR